MLQTANTDAQYVGLFNSKPTFDGPRASLPSGFLIKFLEMNATFIKGEDLLMNRLIHVISREVDDIAKYCNPFSMQTPTNKKRYCIDITELVKIRHPIVREFCLDDLSKLPTSTKRSAHYPIVREFCLDDLSKLPTSTKRSAHYAINITRFARVWAKKAIHKKVNMCRPTDKFLNELHPDMIRLCDVFEHAMMQEINMSMFGLKLLRYLKSARKS